MILTDYAREALGTPFRHQGRVCGLGLDCVGLIVHIAKRAGIPHKDVIAYSRYPQENSLKDAFDSQEYLKIIDKNNLQEGDILLMKFYKFPQHAAYFTGSGIIHAYAIDGKVVEHRLDKNWQSRIVAAYRFVQ